MDISLILSQARRVGFPLLLAPILTGLAVGIGGLILNQALPSFGVAALSVALTPLFTIVTGSVAITALTGDTLIEIHESTPCSFRKAQLIRAAAVALSSMLGACMMFAPLYIAGLWAQDVGWVAATIPAGAALFVVIITLISSAFSTSISTVTISTTTAWIFLTISWDLQIPSLLVKRGVPFLLAILLVVTTYRRLGNSEKNIAKVAAL